MPSEDLKALFPVWYPPPTKCLPIPLYLALGSTLGFLSKKATKLSVALGHLFLSVTKIILLFFSPVTSLLNKPKLGFTQFTPSLLSA